MKGVERMKIFKELTDKKHKSSQSKKIKMKKESVYQYQRTAMKNFARNAIKSKRHTATIKYEIQRIVNEIKNKGC